MGPVLVWEQVGRDLWRSVGSRFDVLHAPATGRWVAFDADRGRCFRGASREAAVAWCERVVMREQQGVAA